MRKSGAASGGEKLPQGGPFDGGGQGRNGRPAAANAREFPGGITLAVMSNEKSPQPAAAWGSLPQAIAADSIAHKDNAKTPARLDLISTAFLRIKGTGRIYWGVCAVCVETYAATTSTPHFLSLPISALSPLFRLFFDVLDRPAALAIDKGLGIFLRLRLPRRRADGSSPPLAPLLPGWSRHRSA